VNVITKAIEFWKDEARPLVEVRLTGKLEKDDYEELVPAVEDSIEKHGRIDMLVQLDDFHGWTVGALWEDLKFDLKHFRDIERLALVGDSKWEAGMAAFCRPFTTAEIKYFHEDRLADAREWIEERSA